MVPVFLEVKLSDPYMSVEIAHLRLSSQIVKMTSSHWNQGSEDDEFLWRTRVSLNSLFLLCGTPVNLEHSCYLWWICLRTTLIIWPTPFFYPVLLVTVVYSVTECSYSSK